MSRQPEIKAPGKVDHLRRSLESERAYLDELLEQLCAIAQFRIAS
ncbi:MAG: hypothetical protein WA695_01210 [Candidatus Dormiibacterota bacterium]